MKYDFNEVHNRLGTYCTQWDYIQDRFNKKDLIPSSISDNRYEIISAALTACPSK